MLFPQSKKHALFRHFPKGAFMSRTRIFTMVTLLILLVSSACAQTTSTPTTVPTSPVTQILPIDSPTAPPSSTPSRTATFSPTNLPPTSTLLPTNTLSPTPTCTNQAEFVKHLSVGDNTAFKPGEYFAKLWQIKNVGTCTWTQEYSLVFVSGEIMNGPEATLLPQNVAPGETVDLRVDLVAPNERYSHTGSWMLQDSFGNLFGLGESADQAIEVTIFINPTPRPTSG